MKKYLLGLMAIVFAVAGSAFTTLDINSQNQTSLYWFKYDEGQGKFVYDRHGASPTIVCDGLGDPCAQGFQNPNPQGTTIYPGVNLLEEIEQDL